MKIRQGKDIILRWQITTNGEALPLEGRNLTLMLSTPNGRERVLSYTTEDDIISTRLFGKEITHLGDYTLTLWENRGEQGQTAVDAVNAFELVKFTTMEGGGSSCGNLETETVDLGVADMIVGIEGPQGPVGPQGPMGPQGEMVPVVNDLTTGGADKALSAEMGKMLGMSVAELQERVHDLGDFSRSGQAEAEAGKAGIAGNPGIVLIRYTVGNQNGIILQQVGETTTKQILFWGGTQFQRRINFSNSDKTSVSSTSSWWKMGATHTSYDTETRRLHLQDMNYNNLNPTIDAVLPLATEEQDGLMSKKQVAELATKAPKVGYAPDLKVNFAKELVGRGEATPEVIGGIRPTGEISIGDGNATIERIKGESVVWNQLSNKSTHTIFNTTSTIRAYGGATLSKPFTINHKILVTCKSTLTGKDGVVPDIQYQMFIGPNSGAFYQINTESTTNGDTAYYMVTPNADTHKSIGVIYYGKFTEGDSILIENIYAYDLTLMFGAGNEPTTIEEFEARKPLGVTNEYNEGTIISYDGDALKSVGFNAYNGTYAKVIGGEEYHATGTTSISFAKELGGDVTAITLDSNKRFIPEEDGYVYAEGKDIVIHLTHSYTPEHVDEYEEDVHVLPDVKSILDANGNQLIPYGLLSAGSVHDEITATKAIKRVGVVDMGTLNWTYTSEQMMSTSIKSLGFIGNPSSPWIPNILCHRYPTINRGSMYDKSISGNCGTSGDVRVKDSSYTDAITFKQAMSGVLLYYELATPIEVDLPEPLNMTYEAWDFGTEELVYDTPTTPLNAEIVYQFNAVDRIRENSSAIDSLGTDKADKSALEAINKEVEKKQDKLKHYIERPDNNEVVIAERKKVSLEVDDHENIATVGAYIDSSDGITPIARIESTYDNGDYARVETRGSEVNIYGDYVTVNDADLIQTIKDVATHTSEIASLQNNKQNKLVSGTNIKTINGEPLLGEGNIEIGSSGYQLILNKTFTEDVASYDATIEVPNITSYTDFIILIEFKYQEGVSRGGHNFLLLNSESYPKVAITASNLVKESYRTHYILKLHVGDFVDMTAYLESHNNAFSNPQVNDGNVGINWICNLFDKAYDKITSFIFGHGFIIGEKLKIYAR